MYEGVSMLSKPARGKQPTPQPWPSPPEMAPYRRIWSPILGAYALDWLGTMPWASEYAFLRQWAGPKLLKSSGGAAMMVMNLASPLEHFEGFRPAHCWGKHICLLGASSPIDQTRRSRIFCLLGGARGAFLVAAAMVMWVLLAVGRWPLVAWCFCWHKSYIIVGIV